MTHTKDVTATRASVETGVLHLDAISLEMGPSSPQLGLEGHPGGAWLSGDDTGYQPLFLHVAQDGIRIARSVGALLDDLARTGARPRVCAEGVSHVLHHGFVPLPHTALEGMFELGIGDQVSLEVQGSGIKVSVTLDYPYYVERSRQDQQACTSKLLELMVRAVDRQLGGEDSAVLLMSAGKDSTGIALALAEADRTDVLCVTFELETGDDEPDIAAETCRKLGLKHEVVALQLNDPDVLEVLVDFFTESPLPTGDCAVIPTLLCLARSGLTSGTVVDGMGNDLYMGQLPGLSGFLKERVSIGYNPVSRALARLLPVDSTLNFFLRSKAGACTPGRTYREHDTARFFEDRVATSGWWKSVSGRLGNLHGADFRCSDFERHLDHAQVAQARFAGSARGLGLSLPFCDQELIDYVFHLPESHRFHRKKNLNKPLLRRLLAERLGYDAAAVGKRSFMFNGDQFLFQHRDFVLNEIEGCPLWNDSVGEAVRGWMRRMERRPTIYQSLLVLFQVSAWVNHSRFIDRSAFAEASA